jgi:hypothetical protein
MGDWCGKDLLRRSTDATLRNNGKGKSGFDGHRR